MENNRYLLYGSNRHAIKEKTVAILHSADISTEDTEMFDMNDTPVQSAVESAMTIPFLSDQKAVIIDNAMFVAGEKSDQEIDHVLGMLEDYWNHPNPTTLLIVRCPYDKLDQNAPLVKKLLDQGESFHFGTGKQKTMFDDVRQSLEKEGFTIAANALQMFIGRTKKSNLMMYNELNKLMMYKDNEDKHITIDDVRAITIRDIDDNIFELTNALLAKDRNALLRVYEDLLQINMDPMWMIGVLVRKFQEILYTQELLRLGRTQKDIQKHFKVSKGRAYYMVKNARDVTKTQLDHFLGGLSQLDYAIKSGKMDKQLGLEMFLLKSV